MSIMLLFGFLLLSACGPVGHPPEVPYITSDTIHNEPFDSVDSRAWIIESEVPVTLAECISNGALDLDVPGGITVWHTTRFNGDILFEFEVTVIEAGGKNDRVSDLNCFWMATDPAHPDDFFRRSSWRKGTFWHYYTLNLYYVGYGGHDNTKTRMRRYDTSLKPPPPILQEYNDVTHRIVPNQRNRIQIACFGATVSYFFNGEEVFAITDERPYREGYFGFRTTDNHMKIHNFTVYALTEKEN